MKRHIHILVGLLAVALAGSLAAQQRYETGKLAEPAPRQQAMAWLLQHTQITSDESLYGKLDAALEEALAGKKYDIWWQFGSELTKSGKPAWVCIRDREFFAFELTDTDARLLELSADAVRTSHIIRTTSPPDAPSFVLGRPQIRGGQLVDGRNPIHGSIAYDRLRPATGSFYLQVEYSVPGVATTQVTLIDAAINNSGNLEFEFQPINRADSENKPIVGLVPMFFRLYQTDDPKGDQRVAVSRAVGILVNIR